MDTAIIWLLCSCIFEVSGSVLSYYSLICQDQEDSGKTPRFYLRALSFLSVPVLIIGTILIFPAISWHFTHKKILRAIDREEEIASDRLRAQEKSLIKNANEDFIVRAYRIASREDQSAVANILRFYSVGVNHEKYHSDEESYDDLPFFDQDRYLEQKRDRFTDKFS